MAFEWWQSKKRDLETNNKGFLKKKYICLSLTMKFGFSVFYSVRNLVIWLSMEKICLIAKKNCRILGAIVLKLESIHNLTQNFQAAVQKVKF
jgi:hypothetical protein